MSPSTRRETRFTSRSAGEVRARRGADGKVGIDGLAAVYGVETDLGPFVEVIAPGFFDGALARADVDVRGLFNHDPNFVLGRSTAGTLKVRTSPSGLTYEVPELPRSRADVAEAIERRDVTGNSFSFTVPADGSGEKWERLPGGRDRRTLIRAEELFDVGPVTFPAYSSTTVALRSRDRALNGTPAPPRYRSDDERRDAVRRVRAEQVADEVRADAGRAAQEDSIAARARQRREDALTRTRLSPKPRPSSFGAHVRAMCQHESAHAVAGWATGNPATGITLDYRATTHGWRIRGGETQFISDTSAIVRLAGIAADVLAEGRLAAVMRRDASGRPRLTPEFRAELESSGARGDWRYTRGLVSRGSGFDGENDPDVAFARAVDVVREHWNAIEAATDALVTAPAGRLDGREIQDAIDSARGLWLRQRR